MTSVSTARRQGLNSSAAIKVPCAAATTANIVLSGLQTVDGVALSSGNRVLVKNQTTQSENGIYVVDTGAWTRDLDFDGYYDVVTGTLAMVLNGTTNGNTYWRVSTTGTITIGTTNIAFAEALFDDVAALAFLQAGAGAVLRSFQSKNRDLISVKDFGAVGDGATADTTAIQAAIDSVEANNGGLIYFTGPNDTDYAIDDTISLPFPTTTAHDNLVYSLRGTTRRGVTVKALAGMADKAMFDFKPDVAPAPVTAYDREMRDLQLEGNSIAKYGIDARFNQNCLIENVSIHGLQTSGANVAAGVVLDSCICSTFRRVIVSFGDGHGIWVRGSTFLNAVVIDGCEFWYLSGTGLKIDYGATAVDITGNTFERLTKGIELSGVGHPITILGNYFEDNNLCHIDISPAAYIQKACLISGNYLLLGGANNDASFTPILMTYADGVTIENNSVPEGAAAPATGYVFLDADLGGSVSNCVVRDNHIGTDNTAADFAANKVFNISHLWAEYNNSLEDARYVPFTPANLNTDRGFLGGWTQTPGSGSIVRGVDIMGGPGFLFTSGNPNESKVEQTFSIPTSFQGKFVTMAVPVQLSAGAYSASSIYKITPNGTGAAAVQNDLGADTDPRIRYLTVFIPADATTLAVLIQTAGAGNNYVIGVPCIYIGAKRWYNNGNIDPWLAAAAPSTGTWKVGDQVWNSAAPSGGAPGWVCTTAPATFKAMGNLA